jgi:hypothetical protein
MYFALTHFGSCKSSGQADVRAASHSTFSSESPSYYGGVHQADCPEDVSRKVSRRVSSVSIIHHECMNVRTYSSMTSRQEVVCDEPLLIADKQIGLTVVHPAGKVRFLLSIVRVTLNLFILQSAKTVFRRVRYDPATNTSIVECTWWFDDSGLFLIRICR